MNSKKLGQFIAELRKAHNLTQRQLADSLSVTDKAVSKWERGLS
ncbi:MAG: helix-turn-helix domain-containing protein, partial [Oscillospiraceae bacterium]|nr:helix-turn-helix domain-containing protein [Oscillospiraceae bacterium]